MVNIREVSSFTKFWYNWENRRRLDLTATFFAVFFLDLLIWILNGEKASIRYSIQEIQGIQEVLIWDFTRLLAS